MFIEYLKTVASQAAIMFILAAVGFILGKTGLVQKNSISSLTNVLLWACIPAVIIQAFTTGFDAGLARSLLIFALASILVIGLSTLIAGAAFSRRGEGERAILNACVTFCNSGFMCLPLVQVFYGSHGVMYCSIFVAIFNIIFWTYGYAMLSGKGVSLVKLVVNPGILALVIALPIFFFGIDLPRVVDASIDALAVMQTPLAMVTIGAQLAFAPLLIAFAEGDVYAVSFLKLLLIPVLVAGLLWIIPVPLDATAKAVLVIEAGAPTATVVALAAPGSGKNNGLAGRCVAMTTLFSILTLPLCVLLSNRLFG